MNRRLEWTSRALRRMEEIGIYIAPDSPTAADNAMTRLLSAAQNLCTHPAIGRTGRITGTRELVLADLPYNIIYRVTETRLEILTVIHKSQRWPKKL